MIAISTYQENWLKRFQEEKARLENAFSGLAIQFHHIGSTSIIGCRAKPVIDILGVTPDITEIDAYNSKLEEIGYAPMGEYGMKQRRFFRKEGEVHLHVFEDSDPETCRHLRFAAYLNANPQAIEVYGDLKENLARKHPGDMESYILGKEGWIKEIDYLAVKGRTTPLSYPLLGPRKAKWNQQQIIDAMHANTHLHMTYFAKYHPRMNVVFQPDVTAVQAELKDDMFNYILSARFTEENASERVDTVLKLYRDKVLPFSWWVSEARDTPANLGKVLMTKGLSQKEVDAGMYLELEDLQPRTFEAKIRRVEVGEMVRAFADVIVSVGGDPRMYEMIYKDIPLPLIQEGAPFELYLLFVEDKPATSGIVVFHANVAGIYYVATDPRFRRRGLATTMMRYLLARARAKGYHIATLQASEKGKSLYEHLGFTQICRFVEYS